MNSENDMSQPDLDLHTNVARLNERVSHHADLHVEHRDAIRGLVSTMASREGWFKGIGTIVTIAAVASAVVTIHASLAKATPAQPAAPAAQKASP